MNKCIYILIFVFFISCEKESPIETPVTIEPGAYYPAYPGSQWIYYSSYYNDTVIVSVEPEYRLHSFESYNLNCFATDSVYVPFIGGNPYYGYSIPKEYYSPYPGSLNNGCIYLEPFLNEEIGGFFRKTTNVHGNGYTLSVDEKLDTLTVRGNLYSDIIVVLYEYNDQFGNVVERAKTYYAKNVGKIKSIWLLNTNPAWTNTGVELIFYSINR